VDLRPATAAALPPSGNPAVPLTVLMKPSAAVAARAAVAASHVDRERTPDTFARNPDAAADQSAQAAPAQSAQAVQSVQSVQSAEGGKKSTKGKVKKTAQGSMATLETEEEEETETHILSLKVQVQPCLPCNRLSFDRAPGRAFAG